MTPQCVSSKVCKGEGGGVRNWFQRGRAKLVKGEKNKWFKEGATLVSRGRSKTG